MGRPSGGSRRPCPGHSFFLFAPSGLCRPSLGCILPPLCPFGPLPSQPSAVYPFRGVVFTVALRLPAHKTHTMVCAYRGGETREQRHADEVPR